MSAPMAVRVLLTRAFSPKNLCNFASEQYQSATKLLIAPTFHAQKAHQSTVPQRQYDVVIVGGGIVGLATARELLIQHPNLRVGVLEKEHKVALHQSGHNSGVIHAGIYYQPGSLKAKLCIEGLKLTYEYCAKNDIPYRKCGKLIVATSEEELPRLENLRERAEKNGVPDIKMVDSDGIKEIEPHCVGLRALHSPHTGIVDWQLMAQSYGEEFTRRGGTIHVGFTVKGFEESSNNPEYPLSIIGKNSYTIANEERVHAKYMIACGGLQSDILAELSGCDSNPRIVPFRGEYLVLRPEKSHLVQGNIYPVPNPKLPFLGVHFTPRMNGDIWLGPNAVLAFKREGYRLTDFNLLELFDALSFRGLQKLVLSNFGYAIGELYRGIDMSAQVKQLKRYIPEISTSDVTRGPAGVRAQALAEDGQLVEDFVFDVGSGALGQRMLHVRNAPSPAATSSMAIAKMVIERANNQFQL